ncbi:hypothetical protein [Tenacibaculum phage PTm5]|nr:hypothetical protein [Tenacibaculum phage PTm5]
MDDNFNLTIDNLLLDEIRVTFINKDGVEITLRWYYNSFGFVGYFFEQPKSHEVLRQIDNMETLRFLVDSLYNTVTKHTEEYLKKEVGNWAKSGLLSNKI